MLQQENIDFVYYFGEMTREEKEDNVKAFHAAEEVKVMVRYQWLSASYNLKHSEAN